MSTALDIACRIRQRDARAQTSRLVAPVAPMPTDPQTCRWCDGHLKTLILPSGAIEYCQLGCAPNWADPPPYEAECRACCRAFSTGQHYAVRCWECAEHDRAELRARQAAAEDHRDWQQVNR